MKKKQLYYDNYIRAITIDKIVDGDTIHIVCDLWFDVRKKMKVRLARINCPEKDTEEWIKVKEYMQQHISKNGFIWSLRYDKYGRWLCEVIIDDVNISDHLIELWYAKLRDGKWKKPI